MEKPSDSLSLKLHGIKVKHNTNCHDSFLITVSSPYLWIVYSSTIYRFEHFFFTLSWKFPRTLIKN